MDIQFLYFDDCPNWRTARDRLDEVVGDDHSVEMLPVETHDQAVELGFRGSPTILVAGVDPFATGDEPPGLACRIFQTPSGPQGSPTVEQLRSAVAGRSRGAS